MTSGKCIVRALRGLFVIAAALSTELVTSLLPTGEVSTLTDIHEYESNEGNTQVETLSTLACLKNTLRSTWERQSFGCIAWTTLRSSRTSYVARDWNMRWTYECHHRIIESFRSDMSYSLCQVWSTLYPGNEQASFNSSLAAPEVCWRVSHCAKDWERMGGIVDRHSDWVSSDNVSEKWWWSYKRQRHA